MSREHIRNFCIIAHIDHGKSTLADRLLEVTQTIAPQDMREQVLDDMDLERERGITIKMHPIRMIYEARDGKTYVLNLIDTPGHVDFSYEVSRSLAACEGAILVVDATQGVEAQTVSNLYLALDHGLTVIPVINKIDLGHAELERTRHQVSELLAIDGEDILLASAKQGVGTEEILERIVREVPPPSGLDTAPLRALVFDSVFDPYRGAIPYIRVIEGTLEPGLKIRLFSQGLEEYEVSEVGYFRMGMVPCPKLVAGDVGYLIAGIRNISDARVGDTVTSLENPAAAPLPGYRPAKPMVFSGLYPAMAEEFEGLRAALEKLKLNDAALFYEPETSSALGFGFRCGFLGLLHMEIVQERLEREHNLNLIATIPNVAYRVVKTNGDVIEIDSPAHLPPPTQVEHIEEPYLKAQILTPADYIGPIMNLGQEKRGLFKGMNYLDPTRVFLSYEFPLAEVIFDFYDRLKSLSRGYASFDYEYLDHRESDLVKLDILVNGDPVDALSSIIHRSEAYEWGKSLVGRLRKLIPRQLFEVALQAALGSKVIARENIPALRKNVTAKCYGGDITRKRKLLERQKEGKRRMKQVGNVEIPQEAFLAVLRAGD